MATFTMELKTVVEHVYSNKFLSHEWEQGYASFKFNDVVYGKLPTLPDPKLIGLGTYPIFDEGYRAILNGKIIDEYFTREIATETIDNWILMIRRKMDQIMPFYNKLYLSEKIPYSALDTMRIHSVSKGLVDETQTAKADTTSLTETDSKGRAVQSNTPQTMLAGNEDYASSASDSVGESDVKGSSINETEGESKTTSDTDNLVTGYQAIASDLIQKYRASLLNIDASILNELQDCFMLLLNNGDSYHANTYYYGWAY
jgi:hypothetical protein